MPVKGIELTSIEARRFVKAQERLTQIKIDHNSTITVIRSMGPRDAAIEFRYTANYVSVGMIKLEGALHWEGDAPQLAEKWQQSGQIPPEIFSEVQTAVMRVCIVEAVTLAKDLQLPPPIPLPAVPPPQIAKPPSDAKAHGVEFG